MSPVFTAHNLPLVDPLFVRRFAFAGTLRGFVGGVYVMDAYEVEDVGPVESRFPYDEDVVDCSQRVFQITTNMMFAAEPLALTVFPSRRWRNHRTGEQIDNEPEFDRDLLYIGNPVRLFRDAAGTIDVIRSSEFLIKSGPELGY